MASCGRALLFASADALQLRIQTFDLNIPYHFLNMLPYILTIVALSGVIGKSAMPAAVGKPFLKEQ